VSQDQHVTKGSPYWFHLRAVRALKNRYQRPTRLLQLSSSHYSFSRQVYCKSDLDLASWYDNMLPKGEVALEENVPLGTLD
jgi:hypothetical protein